MNYISAENISKAYGDKQLFEKISFGINHRDKVALVAKNGTGKTTLINILKGIEIPDEGKVSFRKEITIGFLDQEPKFDENLTVIDTLLSAKNKMTDAIKKYNRVINSETQEGLDEVLIQMND